MNGFLNILKPPGMSSGAVVAVIKRLTGEKIGHTGTLDPEAAGVLPVMVGKATKLLDYIPDREKEYIAQLCFGVSTDTQDAQGKPIEVSDKVVSKKELEEILPKFIGEIDQCPPAYSAIKLNGKPLYALARQGKMIEGAARKTLIRSIEILDQPDENLFTIRVRCGRGTYIRTLCHDIGTELGYPAHMRYLLRTNSGFFHIENAVTLEELIDAPDKIEEHLLPLDQPLNEIPRFDLPDELKKPALNGVALPDTICRERYALIRLYLGNEFIGISRLDDGLYKTAVLLKTANDIPKDK